MSDRVHRNISSAPSAQEHQAMGDNKVPAFKSHPGSEAARSSIGRQSHHLESQPPLPSLRRTPSSHDLNFLPVKLELNSKNIHWLGKVEVRSEDSEPFQYTSRTKSSRSVSEPDRLESEPEFSNVKDKFSKNVGHFVEAPEGSYSTRTAAEKRRRVYELSANSPFYYNNNDEAKKVSPVTVTHDTVTQDTVTHDTQNCCRNSSKVNRLTVQSVSPDSPFAEPNRIPFAVYEKPQPVQVQKPCPNVVSKRAIQLSPDSPFA